MLGLLLFYNVPAMFKLLVMTRTRIAAHTHTSKPEVSDVVPR